MATCNACGGYGKQTSGVLPCNACGGSGRSGSDTNSACFSCGGSGQSTTPRYTNCYTCSGTGQIKDGGGGGCYISTACVVAKGLPDDCYELTCLRNFRDSYMLACPEKSVLVQEYYNLAPMILQDIENSEKRDEIYSLLYENLILKSIHLIQRKEYGKAMENYISVTRKLEKTLLLD